MNVGLNLLHPEHHNRCVLKQARSLHRKFQELRICVFKFKTFFTRAVEGEEVLEIVLFYHDREILSCDPRMQKLEVFKIKTQKTSSG